MEHITQNTKSKTQKNRLARMLHTTCYILHAPAASRQEGYTLIEMLTISAIITMLLGAILVNYTKHRGDEMLLNETYKVAQLIRRAQNLALSPQGSGINGFGIYLATSSSGGDVILFANNNADNIYNSGEDKEILTLNSQVKISALEAPIGTPLSPLNILYVPPDPEIRITGITGGATAAIIRIENINDSNKFRIIELNTAGLVEVK